MIIDLSNVTFVNDFFAFDIPNESTLILNVVDELIKVENTNTDTSIKRVNIVVVDKEGKQKNCPCTIGLSNDILSVNTDYINYEGKVLTPENMVYCTIEIYE